MTAEFKWYKYKFGEAGNLAAIPNDTQGGGELSLQEGWGSDYELDPDTQVNAKFISRSQHNQLWQTATGNINFWQKNLYPLHTPAGDNGGVAVIYAFGTRVRYDAGAGEKIYEVIDAAGTDSLPSVTADWALVSSAYPRSGTAGGEQRTNTQNEALFQDTGDYRASADDAGMVARGFTLSSIPPLVPAILDTSATKVSDATYPGTNIRSMSIYSKNNDLYIFGDNGVGSPEIYVQTNSTGPYVLQSGIPGGNLATGSDINQSNGDVWFGSGDGRIYRRRGGGTSWESVGNFDLIAGIADAIAVDSSSGRVWAFNDADDSIYVLSPGSESFVAAMSSPATGVHGMAIDPRSGNLYIARSAEIWVSINGLGDFQLFGSFPGVNAYQIDVNEQTGRLWIADRTGQKIYYVDESSGVYVEYDSVLIPVGVAINSETSALTYTSSSAPSVWRAVGITTTPQVGWYIKT